MPLEIILKDVECGQTPYEPDDILYVFQYSDQRGFIQFAPQPGGVQTFKNEGCRLLRRFACRLRIQDVKRIDAPRNFNPEDDQFAFSDITLFRDGKRCDISHLWAYSSEFIPYEDVKGRKIWLNINRFTNHVLSGEDLKDPGEEKIHFDFDVPGYSKSFRTNPELLNRFDLALRYSLTP